MGIFALVQESNALFRSTFNCPGEHVKCRGARTTVLGGEIGLSLATHLHNVALIKSSHAGGVLVCDKDTESEDMLACLSQAASEDTQKSLVAKLASYWFPK